MKIYYKQNENQEITEDGQTRFSVDCKEIDKEDYLIAEGYNGAFFFLSYMETDEYQMKAAAFRQTRAIKMLRRHRELECFPIINRGELWYDRLTTEQRAELKEWYEAWLNVTETKIEPKKPKWLGE